MANPLFSTKPIGKTNSVNSAKSATNSFFGSGAAGGVPVGIASPSYMGPVIPGGADLTQFPGVSFHNGIGGGPIPNTDPVGAYTYGNTSVNDLLSQINSLYGGKTPDFSGEASQQASKIYAPVLQDLNNQGALAKKRSTHNDAQLKAMYAALQGSIGTDGTAMQKQNNSTVVGMKNLGKQTQSAIGADYGNAMNDAASIMQKLGIQEAAGANIPRIANNEGFMQSLAGMNTQGAVNLASQIGQNAQNFNTAQKNISGFEGTENRYKNTQNLEDRLAGLASEKAQVGSQQASQAAGFMQNMQNQYLNSINQRASALTQMYSQQQQMALAQQNMQMDMLKMQYEKSPSAYQQFQMTPMADKLAAYSGQLFGAGGDTASKALQFIESMGNTQSPSGLAFADMVAKAAQNNPDPELRGLNPNQLRALAMQAYSQTKVNPNAINYIGP